MQFQFKCARSRHLPALRIFAVVLVVIAMFLPSQSARATTLSWWDGQYGYRQHISVTTGASAITGGYSLSLTLSDAKLVTAGQSLSSGNDLRVAYYNGSTWSEIPRVLDFNSAWNAASTKVWFQAQNSVGANSSDTGYYVYWGNPSAAAPGFTCAQVFIQCDDFSSGSLNSSLWSIDAATGVSAAVSGGKLHITGSPVSGHEYDTTGIRTINSIPSGIAIDSDFGIVKQSTDEQASWKARLGLYDSSFAVESDSPSTTKLVRYYSSGWSTLGTSFMQGQTFSGHHVTETLTAAGDGVYYEDGVQLATHPGDDNSSQTRSFEFSPNQYFATGDQSYDVTFDNIVIRNFVSVEPTAALDASEIDANASVTANVLVDPVLVFTVGSHAGACNGVSQTGGVTVNSSAVNFGHFTSAANPVAAQDLSVGTNAGNGYTVFVRYTEQPSDGRGHIVADISSTNASPGAFPSTGTAGLGYSTSDSALGTGTANRFTSPSAHWAALSTANAEVSFSPVTTASKVVCVAYQAGVSPTTPAGAYSTSVIYSAVPNF